MLQVNRNEFEQIKANFAKLRSELSREKLAAFEENVKFFSDNAAYAPSGDIVTRQEWQALAKEVVSARRASLMNNGETQNYRQFKADAKAGISRQPDNKSGVYAEIMARLLKDPELRELASGLAGMTKEQLKGDLPS
jgi:hypothetical protein